jgi:TMEM175 potassium channel family protein
MIGARERGSEAGRELDRIVNFSDGVFAIVITLLVLDIRVPNIPEDLVSQGLTSRILALGPKYSSYVIGFVVIAIYWQAHHRVFRPMRSYDRTLLCLNILFLLTISFLPFPTSLLGEYSEEQLSVVISVVVASLLLVLISWYATAEHRLVVPDLDDQAERNQRVHGLVVPVVFVSSIGISFFSPRAATYCWLLLSVTNALAQRVRSRW